MTTVWLLWLCFLAISLQRQKRLREIIGLPYLSDFKDFDPRLEGTFPLEADQVLRTKEGDRASLCCWLHGLQAADEAHAFFTSGPGVKAESLDGVMSRVTFDPRHILLFRRR